ncbi:alpha-ketoglutarate-dependent dioxygenase AlkB [Lutibacter sp. TH_r2]|uniref:alpha-ketoglutarate-dependent dioxygenase AlkB family protein n=1 Tax=Lutibacter sp. TH_r2 TaxID=3082083 RepID=UPI0029559349|nr:alpha-ketoglutarate-dependent dioxygenase AlkB [Lutibacter sp. TH_r2]MDV7186757.1 alpha-ketoglutarate-dependent dioxygenase AlkB [Lutibacter sp. TH_r2]
MKLFETEFDASKNWLPYNGTVHFFGGIFNSEESQIKYTQLLSEIEWKNDEVIIYGKHIVTKRKTAWYGNKPYKMLYSKIERIALPWNKVLLELKEKVEAKTGEVYNSCICNLYHSGEEGMSWHADDEKELKQNGSIASLSFGATRKFDLKHKTLKEKISFNLVSGELLEMKGEIQEHWLHSIPKTKKVLTPRINLTFRQIVK